MPWRPSSLLLSSFTISNIISSEFTWPVKVNFMRKGVCINGHGHMTKMAASTINSKNLKKSLKQVDRFETWYVALGTPAQAAHYSLCKL